MVLSLLKVALNFELLSKVLMSVLEQILPELHNESDHLIVHLGLFVHINCKIGFVGRQIHFFGFLVMTFRFKLPCLGQQNVCVFAFR